jgi:putative toxin-antitoxin system antitoxin component (TIGR02293 family)
MFHMDETSRIREEPPSALLRKALLSGKGAVRQHLAEAGERGFRGGTPALVAVVAQGLPFGELEALREQLDLPLDSLAGYLGLARATLHRRKVAGQLTADESDKVLRFARLLGQALKIFGGLPEARGWLKAPQYGLGGVIPLEFAGTEVGAREVESLLGRIDHGVYS